MRRTNFDLVPGRVYKDMACNYITHGAPFHRIMARDVIEEEMMCVWKGNGRLK